MDIVKLDMMFNNFDDFYENAKYIKSRFDLMSLYEKRIYKMI